ncbi:MAG TPA: LemA family protein, partial [Saprospiraceae bacterium]|nr:LemA family protein [Saprospirales bacterium]HRQ31242.1 LemA family protein [Saprospiraceae bacterium]
MKNTTAIVLIIVGILIFFQGCSSYNGFVDKEENVNNAWAKVESSYQRRADLIPNLVNTVKGYAAHESETLEAVVNARAKATQTTINAENMTAENMAQFQEAQQGLTSALSRLLVTVEKYPDLKANQNFLELQAQLEGTENRIKVARDEFNNEATIYNKAVKRFPGVLFAKLFGFSSKQTFEAAEGAEKAPEVKF